MRTIKEILILIKEEFNTDDYDGLCNAAGVLWLFSEITEKEYDLWIEYLREYIKTRKVFYSYGGRKTNKKIVYAWTPFLKQPRNNWIDKHIKLNS